jgi:hypothetical protein
MNFPIKAVKLAGVLAIALGATVPATLISTPAAAHEMDRDYHRDGGRDFHRDHRIDRYEHRGDFRHHRWEQRDGFWFGR